MFIHLIMCEYNTRNVCVVCAAHLQNRNKFIFNVTHCDCKTKIKL